ncbi:hypothetical protein WN48_00223 [Eufriesea mexicana]|uniref:Uncharacterized protein n=1 Tax=Eufriesea mexicana TaxID=516756 RepID=A0A310SGW6_9HYME|nr:hypothetical protein WN48_00223 [Eufriesea mexicana]
MGDIKLFFAIFQSSFALKNIKISTHIVGLVLKGLKEEWDSQVTIEFVIKNLE